MKPPGLSIVIPSCNSMTRKHGAILYVLESIHAQCDVTLEVIVVDDHSTDDTVAEIRRLFPKVQVLSSSVPAHHVGALRNQGARAGTHETVLFVDDDMVCCSPTTLRMVADRMQSNDFCCGANRLWTSVFWHSQVTREQSASSMCQTFHDNSILPRGINRDIGYRDLNEFTFIGCFGAVNRTIFERVGGFDEDFEGWGLEDTDLMMRLCMGGHRHVLLRDFGVSVIHLTHPANVHADYARNRKRFDRLERERGYYFHVNHFFGVYEGDGYGILSAVPPEEQGTPT